MAKGVLTKIRLKSALIEEANFFRACLKDSMSAEARSINPGTAAGPGAGIINLALATINRSDYRNTRDFSTTILTSSGSAASTSTLLSVLPVSSPTAFLYSQVLPTGGNLSDCYLPVRCLHHS